MTQINIKSVANKPYSGENLLGSHFGLSVQIFLGLLSTLNWATNEYSVKISSSSSIFVDIHYN